MTSKWTKWKVGDTVVVTPDVNGHGGGTFVASHIGRKWLTIDSPYRKRRFDLRTGREDYSGGGASRYAYTRAEYDAKVKLDTALKALYDVTRDPNWKARLTAEQAYAIVAIIKGPR